MVDIIYCGDEVIPWYYNSSTQLMEVVNTYHLGVVFHIQRIGCQTEKNNDALFWSRITFSFFEATGVHCANDAATMMTYVGCCVGTGTGNHFLEHWRTKLTDAGEICGALHEAQNIKRMRGCIFLIPLSLDAPGMS